MLRIYEIALDLGLFGTTPVCTSLISCSLTVQTSIKWSAWVREHMCLVHTLWNKMITGLEAVS